MSEPRLPSAEELVRYVNLLAREYVSFVTNFAALLDGVDHWQANAGPDEAQRWQLLQREALNLLLQHGIRPTARVGEPVDLHFHQVLSTEPAPDAPPDTVTRVLQMGYEMMLPGQPPILLRTARVIVAAMPQDGEMARTGGPTA